MAVRTREEMVAALNRSGLGGKLTAIHNYLLMQASKTLFKGEIKEYTPEEEQKALLNSCGPGAAEAAMEYAIAHCRKREAFSGVSFNGNMIHNLSKVHEITRNDESEFQSFNNVLREFLLPRYAYLDFDRVVDPRHRIDYECGYPKFITPIMYRYMYDRDDTARRVNDIYPDESWAFDPDVYEDEDEEVTTPFEEDFRGLCEDHNLLQILYRMDRLCGIGHYGALLLGVSDGTSTNDNLEQPLDEPELLAGVKNSVGKTQREVLYLRPFDEYLSFIHQYETDVMHPRYGLPKFYNLVFLDMTIDAAGASIGTRLNRRVHWSRVVHCADNLQSSLVFGTPRMQPVFNRLLDLRKIKGGSAEMLWKGGFPGLAFEIDPQFVADDPEFDREEFKKTVRDYSDGLQRYIDLVGIKATTLNPNVANPKEHVALQMQAIAMHSGCPLGVFLGSEEGRKASNNDKLVWNQRLGRRLRTFLRPGLIQNTISRLIALGCMRPPKDKRYKIEWPDLNTPTDEDRSNLSLKWTQALSQYVASGVIHLIEPKDYLTLILGLKPSDVSRIIAAVKSKGGWDKLLKVDPSQGSGVNGVRKSNVTPGQKSGTTGSRPKERNSGTKKVEGTTS